MGEWSILGSLFDHLQAHSPMLGRFWLLLVLVFRILILGTVASDLFEDEQEEFSCNTLQPGCKQVCYDEAFPISLYRFWVFHIVLIATLSLLFLMYAMHHHGKRTSGSKSFPDYKETRQFRRLYIVNVAFPIVTEVGFLVGQWWLYGFKVDAQYPCSRFPCPYTVDCFTSSPAEKTFFLCFYFAIGVLAAISSCMELLYSSAKWFCSTQENCASESPHSYKPGELVKVSEKAETETTTSSGRIKLGSQRTGKKLNRMKHENGKYNRRKTFVV
ncbi:gap junction delta-3 protein-like [Nerophis ophidion]|uniref:gap junction delta-3 protein-like n=1 Tax=Nerophis ophidion TaxID=159077 RepID=UPI002AE01C34|nr:gap junction delta-3 protein-like [Nerophis ophidion]